MNPKDLKLMLAAHHRWLYGERDTHRPSLASASLADAKLRYANLSEADLRGADLRRADLCGANLYEAELQGADLREADLTLVNLQRANLRGARLHDAVLCYAQLDGADLTGTGVILFGAGDNHGTVGPSHLHLGWLRMRLSDLPDDSNQEAQFRLHPDWPAWWATYGPLVRCSIETARRDLAGATPASQAGPNDETGA